jgi:hypothetical protein
MSDHRPSSMTSAGPLAGFVGVAFDRQTYRNLAYLLLAFPLGIAYFTAITTGLSLGVGLLVTLLGLPVLVATLAATLGIGRFEARLAAWLLDVDVDPSAPSVELSFGSVDDAIASVERVVTTPATWTALLLVALKFGFGILAFTAVVTAGAVSAALLATPLVYDAAGVTYTVGPYVVDTLPEALAAAGLGVVALFLSLHVLNGLARFGGFLTNTLLGGRTATDAGESDA